MSADTTEKRRHQRIRFLHHAWLNLADSRYPCQLIDISLRGAMVQVENRRPLLENSPASLTLELENATQITLQGHIAHYSENQIGLAAEKIDLESLSHLRRLLELHLANSTLLLRELSELALPDDM